MCVGTVVAYIIIEKINNTRQIVLGKGEADGLSRYSISNYS